MPPLSDIRRVLRVSASAALLVALLGVYGCTDGEPPTIEAPDPAPPAENGAIAPDTDPDPVLVESKCSQCHTLERVWAATMDRGQWEGTVSRMEANGLVLSDEERARIVDHLSEQ